MLNKNKHMRLFKFGFLVALSCALFFTSCDEDEDDNNNVNNTEQSLTATLSADARFSILVDALSKTGLDATLDGSGTYTVFAPDNDPFAALLNE
jgi:uncharacterized surface protein with fasciclin (FAS1) repeats